MRLMGIVNATPDSFADGGRYRPLDRALQLCDEGADIIDIGGESTRPGADEVAVDEELARVLPVVAGLRAARPSVTISVDTRRARVAAPAIDAGASVINDVSAGTDPAMFPLCADRACAMVLMHMRGTPATMRSLVDYDDVCAEVWRALRSRAEAARAAGVKALWLDPGIGFAKTAEQSLALLRDLPSHRDQLVLVGASRKSFLSGLGAQSVPAERLPGSLAVALWCRDAGVDVLRVHDVAATRAALMTWGALQGETS